jgi:hypothetical protein
MNGLFKKKNNLSSKKLEKFFPIRYTVLCCGMIAMKREVAAGDRHSHLAGFPWSECQVRKLATSHCTK